MLYIRHSGRKFTMGMRGVLVQVSPGKLAEFIADSRIAYQQVDAAIIQSLKEKPGKAQDARAGRSPKSRPVKGKAALQEKWKIFSMEKDWHTLHYLLNGTAQGGEGPLADTVLGGKEIPDLD